MNTRFGCMKPFPLDFRRGSPDIYSLPMTPSLDFTAPWRPFWRVWLAPHLVAWGVVCALLLLGLRVTFMRMPFVPYALPFDPAVAFYPLCLLAFGPAGLAGCLAAQAAGDHLCGLPPMASGFRAVGLLLGGMWMCQAVRAWLPSGAGQPWAPPPALAVLAAGSPLLLTQAAWAAVGLEWAGWYPFVYTFYLGSLHHLVLLALLGALSTRAALPGLEGRFGVWTEHLGGSTPSQPTAMGRTLLFCLALLTGVATATAISWIKYGLLPLQPTVLGVHGGRTVPAVTTLLLSMQVIAMFWPDRRTAPVQAIFPSAPPTDSPGGWTPGHFSGGGLLKKF